MAGLSTIKISSKTKQNIQSVLEANDSFRDGIRNALFDMGSKHVSHINILFKKAKHGKFYNGHRASAPGEPLAMLSGNLLRSTNYKVRSYDELEVGFGTLYAKYWEEDVPQSKRRTTLIDAVDSLKRDFENNLLNYVQNEIEKTAK
jgi:hypothetical protein